MNSTKIPLNDLRDVEDEMTRYTSREYSPSKQRNFRDVPQLLQSRKSESKSRPKSAFLPSVPSMATFTDTLSGRKISNDGTGKPELSQQPSGNAEGGRKSFSNVQTWGRSDPTDHRKASNGSSEMALTVGKRGSRVMAVVAAFNSKAKEHVQGPMKQTPDAVPDAKAIENAFESLLVKFES